MKIYFILFAVFVFSALAFGQKNYKTYSNVRFGYSISYPSDLLTPQGEADNGDGQVFTGESAEMRVFGSNMLLNKTLAKEYGAIVREKGESVSYKTLGKNFFVISGKRKGKIYYQKTFAKSNGAFITFMIEYAKANRAVYDAVVQKIVKSFK